jgi:hypothetical protein
MAEERNPQNDSIEDDDANRMNDEEIVAVADDDDEEDFEDEDEDEDEGDSIEEGE